MKTIIPLAIFLILFNINSYGQTDSTTVEPSVQDTILTVEQSPQEKTYKRVSDFKLYGGISASSILLSDSQFESAYAAGYILGFSYKKGRHAYWEIGINLNGTVVALDDPNLLDQNLEFNQIEFPLSVGFNLLGTTRRVLGLRLIGGLVPGVVTKVKENPFDLVKDDFNTFQLGGRLGVGVDVMFLFIEAGYQYGFIDLIQEQDSNLSKLYFVLGFRF
jgi:hypothetical protein